MDIFPPTLIPTLTIGGRVFTDLDNLKILYGMTGSVSGHYSSFKTEAGVNYVVPAAKTFRWMAVQYVLEDTTLAGKVTNLGYGDNAVGIDSATPPTNFIRLGNFNAFDFMADSIYGFKAFHILFNVPTGKYPSFYSTSLQCNLMAFGYEV